MKAILDPYREGWIDGADQTGLEHLYFCCTNCFALYRDDEDKPHHIIEYACKAHYKDRLEQGGVMKGLLLVAHGSRRYESNEEVRHLTAVLQSKVGNQIGTVECAFLELTDPSISEGIDLCIGKGASHVVVLPYFLASGRHVVEDIPAEIAIKQQDHPEVKLEIAPYLGMAPGLSDLLLGLVQ